MFVPCPISILFTNPIPFFIVLTSAELVSLHTPRREGACNRVHLSEIENSSSIDNGPPAGAENIDFNRSVLPRTVVYVFFFTYTHNKKTRVLEFEYHQFRYLQAATASTIICFKHEFSWKVYSTARQIGNDLPVAAGFPTAKPLPHFEVVLSCVKSISGLRRVFVFISHINCSDLEKLEQRGRRTQQTLT